MRKMGSGTKLGQIAKQSCTIKNRCTGLKKSFLCENDCLKIGTFHKGENKETSNVEDLSRENVKHIFETAEPTITNVDT